MKKIFYWSPYLTNVATISAVISSIKSVKKYSPRYLTPIRISPTAGMELILGLIGLFRIPLDIMTITIAAITIGIAVDNTIHYLYRYKENLKINKNMIN